MFTASVSFADEASRQVRTVAPSPETALNPGKPLSAGEPLVAFDPFDADSYLGLFSTKKDSENIAYSGKIAYNTQNVVYSETERANNVYPVDTERDNYGFVAGKGRVLKVRAIRPNNGVASVGQAGVVLARNGEVNYGVLLLFVLLLVGVVVLARLTIRKKKQLRSHSYQAPYPHPYTKRAGARVGGYEEYYPPASYHPRAHYPENNRY